MGLFSFINAKKRDAKGVEKGEDLRPTFKNFFKQFWRKLSHLLSLNILILLQVIPIVVGVLAFFFTRMTPSQTSAIFAPLYGASLIDPEATSSLLLALKALPLSIPVFQPAAYWIIAACALFLILTVGWQSVGTFYVLRGLVRGDAVFVFSDYFYAIKRNFKQGFLFGLLDSFLIVVSVFDILYYSQSVGSFWKDAVFWMVAAVSVLYLFMRPYIYLMLITFDMTIKKMFKNALIFSVLGIKRNLLGLLGVVLLIALHIAFIIVTPISFIVPVILPIVYIFAAIGFMIAYAAYPIIDRYMIAPYRSDAED